MKKAYFFCGHTVPTGHPNGVRLANLGLILKELGYEVSLFGCEIGENEKTFTYKGMHCNLWPLTEGSGFRNAMSREHRWCKQVIGKIENCGKPDVVISALSNEPAQRFLISYCKKNHIPIVESVCEWYDKNNFNGVSGAIKFINNRFSMYVQFPGMKNILAISSLLDNYYKTRGCNTVTIPTIVDMKEYEGVTAVPKSGDGVLRVAYAGSPAKKDYIVNAIRSVALLSDDERNRLQLHFYGPELKQLSVLGISETFLEEYKENIICHGRIPYEQVKTKIAEADFTVLLRPNMRYANAGFPTKVGESMACGTPVIANLTSDLGKYIIDDHTGIVCADETPESCAEAFRKALALTPKQRAQMHINCLAMAEKAFDYRKYIGAMEKFLLDAVEKS